ncbi:MAG: hypothetical protein ACO1QB_13490 [Verrucomicrobiales bacterium]
MMNKYLFLVLAIVCFAIGLLSPNQTITGNIITGIGKALGGVFFILYFIMMLLEKQGSDGAKH